MRTPTYEDWVDSLSDEELKEAYMAGGSDDDVGLMKAYHIKNAEQAEFEREEQREMELFEKGKK